MKEDTYFINEPDTFTVIIALCGFTPSTTWFTALNLNLLPQKRTSSVFQTATGPAKSKIIFPLPLRAHTQSLQNPRHVSSANTGPVNKNHNTQEGRRPIGKHRKLCGPFACVRAPRTRRLPCIARPRRLRTRSCGRTQISGARGAEQTSELCFTDLSTGAAGASMAGY